MRLATVSIDSGPILAFQLNDDLYSFPQAWRAVKGLAHRPDTASCTPHFSAPVGASVNPTTEGLQAPPLLRDIHAFINAGQEALSLANHVITEFKQLVASGAPIPDPVPGDAVLAPIPRPRKNVFCVGRNYADHAKERGADVPKYPVFFTKAPTTVVGPGARVLLPPQTAQFDYEGELAVIIGKEGRDIPKDRACDYIFGYTIINDLTARDLQSSHMQFFKGKSLDGSCPMGPVIVTADEVGELSRLTLETRVNGEIRQSAPLSDMIFDVPTLIESLSDGLTLEPGDIIATGTPSGVGSATGRFLAKGDVVSVTIGPLGTLTTYIV